MQSSRVSKTVWVQSTDWITMPESLKSETVLYNKRSPHYKKKKKKRKKWFGQFCSLKNKKKMLFIMIKAQICRNTYKKAHIKNNLQQWSITKYTSNISHQQFCTLLQIAIPFLETHMHQCIITSTHQNAVLKRHQPGCIELFVWFCVYVKMSV